MDETEKIEVALKSLVINGFEAKFAENKEDVMKMMLDMIPMDAIVGVGDSATIRQIGILGKLESRGTKIINPFIKELYDERKINEKTNAKRDALRSDVFVTSSNAVTLDGKIVNIDAGGNRVVGMIFGPKKAIIVVGRNKIVRDVDEALRRIKNNIAPYHAEIKGIKRNICRVTTIIERKPAIGATVIIVNEDLGLGWDESWPIGRIDKIKSGYKQVTWPGPYFQ